VPSYFVDTSALGKHYHREIGTDRIDALFGETNSSRFISRLCAVEIHSVLAKKVRTGDISLKEFEQLRRRFLFDVNQGLMRIIRISSTHYGLAQKSIPKRRSRRLHRSPGHHAC
jgi:hypothetical protein